MEEECGKAEHRLVLARGLKSSHLYTVGANLNRDVAGNMKTEKKRRVPNYKERASSYHKHLN